MLRSPNNYKEVIREDIDLLLTLQAELRTGWLDKFFSKVVSKNPLSDVCIVLLVFFLVGVVEFGVKHFWVITLNLCTAFALNRFIAAKRPIEYDRRFLPQLTDTAAESYAFPSLESYMSVVIMGHLCMSAEYTLTFLIMVPISLGVVAIVGASRIYARSRFPHQIAGSWVLGFIGLIFWSYVCEYMAFHKMKKGVHGPLMAGMCVLFLVNFALSAEDNSSRFMSVPKQDFVKVMRMILYPEEEDGSFDSRVEKDEDIDESTKTKEKEMTFDMTLGSNGPSGSSSPRKAAQRRAQADRVDRLHQRGKGNSVKRDSFYYLQRTLERREDETTAIKDNYKRGFSPKSSIGSSSSRRQTSEKLRRRSKSRSESIGDILQSRSYGVVESATSTSNEATPTALSSVSQIGYISKRIQQSQGYNVNPRLSRGIAGRHSENEITSDSDGQLYNTGAFKL